MTLSEPELPRSSDNGRARAAALTAEVQGEVAPTSIVTYRSNGRLLIIGNREAALSAARQVNDSLHCALMFPGKAPPKLDTIEGMSVITGGRPEIEGSLGAFALTVRAEDGGQDDADEDAIGQRRAFDLVLDLSATPLIDYEIPPPGYYAPEANDEALGKALAELPDMTGEFEKPKYFNYDPNICAHGNSRLKGCTRCIDACPTAAIVSIGDKVQVNPYLCQGGGSCVAACPSGAMTYTFPTVADLLGHVHGLLTGYAKAGGAEPCLLFHDPHSRQRIYEDLAKRMPESVLPVEVEEIGSVGMDAWLASLAYGANAVILAVTDHTPPKVLREMDSQIGFASAILEGMGIPSGRIRKLNVSPDNTGLEDLPGTLLTRPARFTAPNEKRMILRLAIDHLYQHAPSSRRSAELPSGAPFGEVRVDKKACTLCMGCVSVCPTAALSAGGDLPQLKFVEWNCVQCGLCEKACPEDAIHPHPRINYDSEARQRTRILHEEQPFCCISCGKPFATKSMLDVMMTKLEGHWMFQSEEARRRLQMCEHCRVKDMFSTERRAGEDPRKT